MKINEVLKEAGNFNFATTKATGRNYFLNSVTNQIYAYIDSVSESGAPLQIWEFVNAYMAKYGWTANPQQEQLLKGLSKKVEDEYNEVGQHPAPGQPQQAQQQQTTTQNPAQNAIAQKRANKLQAASAAAQSQMAPYSKVPGTPAWKKPGGPAVWKSNRTGQPMNEGIGSWIRQKMSGMPSIPKLVNAMYAVGMTQHRDPRSGMVMPQVAGSKPDDTQIDTKGQQVINTVKTLKGEQYEKDLQEIVKNALWNLYGADRADYSQFVKDIMSGAGKKNPLTQQQQNPQA